MTTLKTFANSRHESTPPTDNLCSPYADVQICEMQKSVGDRTLLTSKKLLSTTLLLSIISLIPIYPQTASASADTNPGYWAEPGGPTWRSSYNQCWRSGYWTPDMVTPECDPDMFKTAAAPPEAPPVAEAPPEIPLQRFSLSADAFFNFDEATLKPEGKEILDNLYQSLVEAKEETIALIGHTDRLGSASYNKQLSQHRAQAVKDYLVKKGIADERIAALGKGESDPVSTGCDSKNRQQLIACLQPDRRVDIEVSGVKQVASSQ